MKSILSPYDDIYFNEYLLKYTKKYLKKRCSVFTKDDAERKYYLDDKADTYYTPDDIIESLSSNGRVIYFSNQKLINHATYDLGQRFWYDSMQQIVNIIHKLYLEFKRISKEFEIQQRKLSHNKQPHQRMQGAKL